MSCKPFIRVGDKIKCGYYSDCDHVRVIQCDQNRVCLVSNVSGVSMGWSIEIGDPEHLTYQEARRLLAPAEVYDEVDRIYGVKPKNVTVAIGGNLYRVTKDNADWLEEWVLRLAGACTGI